MADAVLFLLNLNFRSECEFIHVTILLRKIDCSFIWCNFHFSFSFCFWNFPYNFITMLITPCWPIWCHVLLAQVLIQVLTVLLVYCLHKQGMRLLLGCVCLWHWKASVGRNVNTMWSIQTQWYFHLSAEGAASLCHRHRPWCEASIIQFFCDGTFYLMLWSGMLVCNWAGGRGFWSLLAGFLSFTENGVCGSEACHLTGKRTTFSKLFSTFK